MPPPLAHMAMHGPDERDSKAKPHVFQTYGRLLRYVKPYRMLVLLLLVLTAAISFLSVLPQQLFGVIVDCFQQYAPGAGPDGQAFAASKLIFDSVLRDTAAAVQASWLPGVSVAVLVIGLVAVASIGIQLVDSLFAMVHGYLMARIGQGIVRDMRNEAYAHLQTLSLSYFTKRPTGDLMSRVVNDVNSLSTVIVSPIADFLRDFFRLGWILFFCFSWDWQLTVAAFGVAPLLLGVTIVSGRFIRRAFRRLRTKMGELNTVIQENISGIRVVKGFGREDHEMDRFGSRNQETYREFVGVAKVFAVFRPTVQFITHVGITVILCFGALRVIHGHLSPGTFVVFLPYASMLYDPIRGLSRFYNLIQQAVASVERVFEVLDTTPDVVDAPDAIALDGVAGRVEFRDVSFSYESHTEVLSSIDITAEPGRMIALVGPSGAGKTTVINLLLRFYDPTRGHVLLDGRDLRSIQLRSLHSKMAMVLQDPFLFNDTVRANIAYGKLDATDAEIVEAARAANAHEFVCALPEGYETVIGERGVRLSGGQKQRLSIARAVLANPRILVFDEATSSVDTETETLIQGAIDRLVANRTTFVVAHRLSTILGAHQILVLDQGRIVEQGTHAELLAVGGLYRKLFDMQFRANDRSPAPAPPAAAQPAPEDVAPLPDEDKDDPGPLVL